MMKLFCFLLLLQSSYASYWTSIAPSKKSLPANDLLTKDGEVLSVEEVRELILSGEDISKLDPEGVYNKLWKRNLFKKQKLIDTVDVQENDLLESPTPMKSNSGVFRFSTFKNKKRFNVYLDRSLHTSLLRKNLLRKLGYKVLKSKYLKSIKIQFPSAEKIKDFIEVDLTRGTGLSPDRWVKEIDHKNLIVTLQDLIVFPDEGNKTENLAMGIKPDKLRSRTVRSLVMSYTLVDLIESVNKFKWNAGRVENGMVFVEHNSSPYSFRTTEDDAKWALREISKLTRSDFKEIVEKAFFPKDVEALLIEKIISRRNSLMKLFNIKSHMEFNEKVSYGKSLKDGVMIEKTWEGYASRFSYSHSETPFKDFRYYLYSMGESLTIDNVISKLNESLDAFDLKDFRVDFHKKQFQEGLEHFIETGEFMEFSVGAWAAPIAQGRLITSRNIVIGNQFGTDNLVQTADVFGYSLNLGIHIGIENWETFPTASIRSTIRGQKTYAHLSPVYSLKKAFETPYKNMFVPLLKKKLKENFSEASEYSPAIGKVQLADNLTRTTSKILELKSFKEAEEVWKIIFNELKNVKKLIRPYVNEKEVEKSDGTSVQKLSESLTEKVSGYLEVEDLDLVEKYEQEIFEVMGRVSTLKESIFIDKGEVKKPGTKNTFFFDFLNSFHSYFSLRKVKDEKFILNLEKMFKKGGSNFENDWNKIWKYCLENINSDDAVVVLNFKKDAFETFTNSYFSQKIINIETFALDKILAILKIQDASSFLTTSKVVKKVSGINFVNEYKLQEVDQIIRIIEGNEEEGVYPILATTDSAGESTFSKEYFDSLKDSSIMKKILEFKEPENMGLIFSRKEKLSEVSKLITENLAIGDSLVITEKAVPSIYASGTMSLANTPISLRLGFGDEYQVVSRIHLYRKKANLLQVYVDEGQNNKAIFSASLKKFIEFTKISFERSDGEYQVKVFDINLNPNVLENPEFFRNMTALSILLEDGEGEALENSSKFNSINGDFSDSSSKLGFLMFKAKSLDKLTQYDVKMKDGVKTSLLTVSDESLKGINYESFSKQVLSYYIAKEFESFLWPNNSFENPAYSLWGSSSVLNSNFEASYPYKSKLKFDNLENKFIKISERKQGWSKSKESIQDILEEHNEEFSYYLWPKETVNDITGLKLYDVAINVNIYERGIKNLINLTEKEIYALEVEKFNSTPRRKRMNCPSHKLVNRYVYSQSESSQTCGEYEPVAKTLKYCKRKLRKREIEDFGECLARLSKKAYKYMDKNHFFSILGHGNFYLCGTVDGFREDSETLNDTYHSNCIGRIGSQYPEGPFAELFRALGIQGSEMKGNWLRETL